MHIPYEMQLEQKNVQMQILYANLANQQREQENQVDPPLLKIAPIVACDDTFRYRNKMEFTFGRRWLTEKEKLSSTDNQNKNDVEIHRKYALGLHVPQRFDKVVEIDDCHIYPAVGNEILELIRETAKDMLLEPYDTKADTGYLRNVGIRTATNTHGKMEVMVNLITSECEVPERLVPLAQALKSRFPEVVCVVQNMRGVKGRGLYEIDESNERLLAGDRSYIEQSINGITFRISANSFFQTNPQQSEILFNHIMEAAKLARNSDVVLDLFCGTGSIGLSLARYAKYVHGVDIVSSAVADANMNATINGISNASFVEMNLDKVKEMARKEVLEIPEANVIVVDPPRAGLHPDLVKYLAKADHVERIVYVSCNPLTQIRDIMELMHLQPNTFHVTSVQPIDMFPNTHHVECVVGIERRAQ